ncbi:MAG: peptide-methionine (S)-S-oxide reductase MsrA [Arenimonas sp.]|nr:peptide-methionine (S)-S-oxide reductase MsrA [Arenimonas sp.]
MSVCAIPGLNLRVSPNLVPLPVADIDVQLDCGVAILAGGCFWCTEAVFTQLQGVVSVEPGYAGGRAERANYDAVCTGLTGHAEVIKIRYDPKQISFGKLLQVFFAVAHDATQLNRQGNDVGTQYRSAIFPQDSMQFELAKTYMQQLNAADIFLDPIATTIEPEQVFYPAEKYHYNYAAMNPEQPYIRAVSAPKAEKLKVYFQEYLAK